MLNFDLVFRLLSLKSAILEKFEDSEIQEILFKIETIRFLLKSKILKLSEFSQFIVKIQPVLTPVAAMELVQVASQSWITILKLLPCLGIVLLLSFQMAPQIRGYSRKNSPVSTCAPSFPVRRFNLTVVMVIIKSLKVRDPRTDLRHIVWTLLRSI